MDNSLCINGGRGKLELSTNPSGRKSGMQQLNLIFANQADNIHSAKILHYRKMTGYAFMFYNRCFSRQETRDYSNTMDNNSA